MASQAEIDLIVDASNTLPQLSRDLDRIVRVAQDGADTIDVDAALATAESLAQLSADLDRVVAAAADGADDIDIDAVLDTTRTVARLQEDLSDVIARAQSGADQDPVRLGGVLDGAATLLSVRDDLDDVVRRAEAAADDIDIDVDIDTDSISRRLRRLVPDLDGVGRSVGSLAGTLGLVTAGAGAAGVAIGGVVPIVAGLVTSLENVLPAGALAVQGMLAVKLASGTVKLAMMGVEDAITAAFDPDADPAELAEAMEKLAPEAQKFVKSLIGLRKEFKDLQLDVQNRLFKDMDGAVKTLNRSALPQLSSALRTTADTLNDMAMGAVNAAAELAADGTLGKALDGATTGLENLVEIPGQATTAFGQLAAAAAPAFDRVTQAVARVADSVAKDLDRAFKSGALEDSIDDAVDALAQLGRIGGNVLGTLRNVLGAASTEGDGLFGTLEKITGALEEATASEGFQEALGELIKTAGTLADNALPLLTTALSILSEMLVILGPPARELIDVLGDQLGEILEAAREPLTALADAFGELVIALTPILELAGELVVALLPSLTPLFETLRDVIIEASPVIEQLAENLAAQLVPILERLPEILEIVLPPFVELAKEVFPVLLEALEELEPSLRELSTALGDLLVELAPVVAKMIELGIAILEKLWPYVGPVLIGLISGVADILSFLAGIITDVVLPALRGIAKLVQGDVLGALGEFDTAISNTGELVARAFNAMLQKVGGIMSGLITSLTLSAAQAGDRLHRGVQSGVDRLLREVASIPQRVLGAVGNLAGLLYGAGQSVISGFINGISSQIGRIKDLLGGVTAMIPDWKGPAETDAKLLTENGRLIMQSLMDGFEQSMPEVRAMLGGITSEIPSAVAVPELGAGAPVVYVSIGNEAVDQYVTARVTRVSDDRDRIAAQGVRY